MGHSVPPVSVPALDWKYCDDEQKREQEKSYIRAFGWNGSVVNMETVYSLTTSPSLSHRLM